MDAEGGVIYEDNQATYTCNQEYELKPPGMKYTRICQSDGTWEPVAPICSRTYDNTKVYSCSPKPPKLCSLRVAINYTPLSMAYETYS